MSVRAKRGIVVSVAIVLLTVVGVAVASRQLKPVEQPVPTTRVERGDLEIDVVTPGEFRAPHSALLTAPPVNGTLEIVSMLGTGTKVKKGEVLLQFDPSEQEYNFEQNESQLRQAEQDIAKAKADAAVQAAQDQTALLKARFDVRRAELDVQHNELVSEIDARKNNLALEEAKRKLQQLEQDVKSRAVSGEANINVLEEKRSAAKLAMQVAQQSIDNMTLKTPIDGIVSVKDNRDATGMGWVPPGIVVPEYRAGDLVSPGRPLIEVLDTSQMEVQAKINENDRANVSPNQPVEIRVDAHPGSVFPAKVRSIAGLAARQWNNTSSQKFDASFQLDQSSPELRPGISAWLMIHGKRLKNVLYLPRQCLFEKDNKQIIYVKKGSGFESQEVKVKYRTESRIVVEGMEEGLEVALVNPTLKENASPGKAAASGAIR